MPKKYPKDKRGRMKVPSDWEAPSGFRGTVVTPEGIQIDYPGPMRRKPKARPSKPSSRLKKKG